ncbi:MAG: hypothetical protein LAQ30_08155 [Acidobacteriia bacterium]|nr:hypothetical protein [Terriglobia bacterium]
MVYEHCNEHPARFTLQKPFQPPMENTMFDQIRTEGECLKGFADLMDEAGELDRKLLAEIFYQFDNVPNDADGSHLVMAVAAAIQERAADTEHPSNVLQDELKALLGLSDALRAKAISIHGRLEDGAKVESGKWTVEVAAAGPIEDKSDQTEGGLFINGLDIKPAAAEPAAEPATK